MQLIRYQTDGTNLDQHGLTDDDLRALTPRLDAARAETLADAQSWAAGKGVEATRRPLDAGFIDLPESLLSGSGRENKGGWPAGLLAEIEQAAAELRERIDAAVLLGIGGSYMGMRAIFEALCSPYHNQLPRARRAGMPRLYFEGDNVDTDTLTALLELLRSGDAARLEDRWGIIVVSKSGGTLETAVAFRLFRDALEAFYEGSDVAPQDVIVPVTGESESRLLDLARAKGYQHIFPVPDGVGGRFSVLTAVGLLPAAVLGLDVRAMLAGAGAMNRHFREAPPEENVVLRYVGVCHLMEVKRGCTTRVFSTWGKRLEAVGLWYDQLLAESLGKEERGALPLTVVNTRDLHSRGQQHQEGRRDKLITNLYVERPNTDPLAIPTSEHDQDRLNELAGKTVPDILAAARQGTNQAYQEVHRPTADLILPELNEHTLGQLFQMLMLATVVEGRLIKINPYGQPGVEAYKRNMNAILRGKA
jgi:glucose-6-phosphate isomerase